jgi:hypothetical protein
MPSGYTDVRRGVKIIIIPTVVVRDTFEKLKRVASR